MRDYIDAAAMVDWLENNGKNPAEILAGIDDYYDNNDELKQEVINRFASPLPYDLNLMELKNYKNIKPPFDNWNYIKDRLGEIAAEIAILDIAEEHNEGSQMKL